MDYQSLLAQLSKCIFVIYPCTDLICLDDDDDSWIDANELPFQEPTDINKPQGKVLSQLYLQYFTK